MCFERQQHNGLNLLRLACPQTNTMDFQNICNPMRYSCQNTPKSLRKHCIRANRLLTGVATSSSTDNMVQRVLKRELRESCKNASTPQTDNFNHRQDFHQNSNCLLWGVVHERNWQNPRDSSRAVKNSSGKELQNNTLASTLQQLATNNSRQMLPLESFRAS